MNNQTLINYKFLFYQFDSSSAKKIKVINNYDIHILYIFIISVSYIINHHFPQEKKCLHVYMKIYIYRKTCLLMCDTS